MLKWLKVAPYRVMRCIFNKDLLKAAVSTGSGVLFGVRNVRGGLSGVCTMIVVLYKGLLVIVGYEWGMWGCEIP